MFGLSASLIRRSRIGGTGCSAFSWPNEPLALPLLFLSAFERKARLGAGFFPRRSKARCAAKAPASHASSSLDSIEASQISRPALIAVCRPRKIQIPKPQV